MDVAIAVPNQGDTAETQNSSIGSTNSQSRRPLRHDHSDRNDLVGKHIAIPKLPSIMRNTKGQASMLPPICGEPTYDSRSNS